MGEELHPDKGLWGKEKDQETGIKKSHEELASHLPPFKVTKITAEAAVTATQLNQMV